MILTAIVKLENLFGMKKIKLEEIIHKPKRYVIKVNFSFFFLFVLVVFRITYMQ